MTITRVQAETELVRRSKKRMQLVGFAVTIVGSNDDLSGPMAVALRAMDITPASPITVTDSDLSAVDDVDEFLDRAELRLLENILGNYDLADINTGPYSESTSQILSAIEKDVIRLREKVSASHGSMEAGTIHLNFAETNDDE